jgi:hypothetical protein
MKAWQSAARIRPGVSDKTMETRVVHTTDIELRQAEAEREEGSGQRDILDRLKENSGVLFRPDLLDAIGEIEWLRASTPENVVTRSEVAAIVVKLREMQGVLDALLKVLEGKQQAGKKPTPRNKG